MSDVPLSDLSQRLQTLFADEQFEAGFALGRHILHFYPRHLDTYKQMGRAALAAGVMGEGIDLLQRALSADPEDGELWAVLHRAAQQQGLATDAETAKRYARALLTPERSTDAIARGHIAAREQNWPAAYRAYREGYLAQPHRIDAGLGLLTTLMRLQQWQPAQTLAEYLLNELPYSLKALWGALLCTQAQGDAATAWPAHYLRTARSLDPTDAFVEQWWGALPDTFPPAPPATLPPWDDTQRWQYQSAGSVAELG